MHSDVQGRTVAETHRPSTAFSERVVAVVPKLGPRDLLWLGAGLGAASGLAESALLGVRVLIDGTDFLATRWFHRDFYALIPLLEWSLIAGAGVLCAIGVALARGRGAGLAVRLLLALALLAPLLALGKLYGWALAILALGVACQLAPWLERRPSLARRLARGGAWGAGLAVAGLAALTFGRYPVVEARAAAALPDAPAHAKNVLLIVMDTVRADAMSLYGAERGTTPRLEEFAKQGVVFEQARSASSWTLPSHASLFTGRWLHEHKAGGARTTDPLDETFPTLAQRLASHGFRTGGATGNVTFLSSWFGLLRGFHHFRDVRADWAGVLRMAGLGRPIIHLMWQTLHPHTMHGLFRKDAARVNAEFLAWLDRDPGDGERPFFAFINYMDAHDPYLPATGHRGTFGPGPEAHDDWSLLASWESAIRQDGGRSMNERVAQLGRDAYDDCLLGLDDRIGELFDALEARGVLDETLVIVTADHGESFGERGFFGHGFWLHRPLVHVPLVMAGPGVSAAGHRVAAPVSNRDIPATVLDLLGLGDESPFPGGSLARHWTEEAGAFEPEPVLSEVGAAVKVEDSRGYRPGYRRCLTWLGYAYHRHPDGREELYEVADAAESDDLIASASCPQEALDRLRTMMDQMVDKED